MARTDSTKKRARKIVLILLVLLVALVIGFLVVYSRMDQLGMVPVDREDIPETFREEVPGEQEYSDVLLAEGEDFIVCLGYYGNGSAGNYAAFSKLPFVDLWVLDLMSTGSLTYTNPNGYMGWKDNVRAYPSLNIDRVEKIVLRVDGQEKEIAVDPQDPFVVIAEGEFEGMTLYTVDGKERAERDFPMPVTDSEVREGGGKRLAGVPKLEL